MKRKYYSWDEAMNLREVKVGTYQRNTVIVLYKNKNEH